MSQRIYVWKTCWSELAQVSPQIHRFNDDISNLYSQNTLMRSTKSSWEISVLQTSTELKLAAEMSKKNNFTYLYHSSTPREIETPLLQGDREWGKLPTSLAFQCTLRGASFCLIFHRVLNVVAKSRHLG